MSPRTTEKNVVNPVNNVKPVPHESLPGPVQDSHGFGGARLACRGKTHEVRREATIQERSDAMRSVAGLILLFCATVALGGEAMSPLSEPDAVREAARVAMAQGVAWFKERAARDPEGWLVGPSRVRSVIGWTNVTVRYRKVTVPVPVWEHTNVVVFVQDSSVGAPRRTVQSQPWRLTGKTNYVEQMTFDPNGPIVREEKRPLLDPKGNVCWRFADLGDSALAVYALRRAGVPDTDPVIQCNLANLREAVAIRGLPDQTWNLAWLAAVFAETPGDAAAELTARLAGRLLDGQFRDGPARGLWGPDSFHHRLLAVALRDYLASDAELQAATKELKERDTRAHQQRVEDATVVLDRSKAYLDSITRQMLRLTAVESPFAWDQNAVPRVSMPGTLTFFYNQSAADLECTAIAALGLAAASDQKRLPAESFRPESPAAAKPARGTSPHAGPRQAAPAIPSLGSPPPPERAIAVLARAANAIAARQSRDGRWDEANLHQPVSDFATFSSVLPVPAIAKSFVPLASPVTPASAAHGAAALAAIDRAVGVDKFGVALSRARDAGLAAATRELNQWIETRRPKRQQPATFQTADVEALLPATALIGRKRAPDVAADELIRWLVLTGQTNGAWRSAQRLDYIPSSSRARFAALEKQPGGVVERLPMENLRLAHIYICNAVVRDTTWAPARDNDAYFTALAVLCLAGYLDQPAAALAEYAAVETLPVRRAALHARLRQPPPAPAPVPVAPPAATGTKAPAQPPAVKAPPEQPPAAQSPLNVVPDLPPEEEKKPQADEAF